METLTMNPPLGDCPAYGTEEFDSPKPTPPEHNRTPHPLDPGELSSARVYDYLLGGKDNYDVDRDMGRQMLSTAPELKTLVWFARGFMRKSVEMAAGVGIRQFVDLGSGIPVSPNVHEVAREIEPSARVVYVDYDPVVVAHCEALLAGPPGIATLLGDIRSPVDILDKLHDGALIDLDKPVALTLVGVLHYVMDDEHPAEIMATLRDRLAPGSYVAITHGSSDSDPEILRILTGTKDTPAQVCFRSTPQTEAFLSGFELLEPGVAPVQQWLRPGLPDSRMVMLGAIGRKPATPGAQTEQTLATPGPVSPTPDEQIVCRPPNTQEARSS